MKLQGCTALITGASAGIGRELARQLARDAHAMVLVARRQDRLEELRTELTRQYPNLIVHLRATDLSQGAEVTELCTWLEREQIAIDFLVNNAGLGDRGVFVRGAPERINEMMQVNIVALTLLTRRLLPAMLAQKRGAILNVSSSASFMPMPGLAVYAASKAYVTSFTEALRVEMRGRCITVTALCPGPVHTEFNTVATRSGEMKPIGPKFSYVDLDEVARAALAAIEHDRPVIIPGWAMKLAMGLVRLTPMPILRRALGMKW